MGLSCTWWLTVAATLMAAGRSAVVAEPALWRDDIPALCVSASVTPVSCGGGAVGGDSLLPHPDHCELFYYCVSAERPPVCRQCPAGLHFSPSEHVCDAPDHAGCQLNQIPEL